MEEHLSPNFGKRKNKLLFELEKKESKKLKRLGQMNQCPQYNRSGQNLDSVNCKKVEIGQIKTLFESFFASLT